MRLKGTPDNAANPARRHIPIKTLAAIALLTALGYAWQSLNLRASPVQLPARPAQGPTHPLPPVADAEQEVPARYFVLVHSQPDSLLQSRRDDSVAVPVVLDRVLTVGRGKTIMDMLLSAGIDRGEAAAAVDALTRLYEPRKLQTGQEIRLSLAPTLAAQSTGRLLSLLVSDSVDRDIQVTRGPDGTFDVSAIAHPLAVAVERHAAIIRSSLYDAGKDAGVPMPVMGEMIKAMSFDVDFQRDIHPGDNFEILYEQYRDAQGRPVKTGTILYAGLVLGGKPVEFYGFTTADGRSDFYAPNGDSVRKALLRTPVDGFRITSGFGMRMHPLLGYTKLHKGIDFGAPPGTPIYAAGDGVVEEAGRKGGYGNYIRLRHNGTYSTAYAHLSRFAKQIRVGARVRQGEVIGYVGSTGEATGPHLHYEVLVAGNQINPLSVKLPTGQKLAGADKERFGLVRTSVDRLRQQIETQQLVAGAEPAPAREH